jgi:membrane protein YdbS with pleckstrin-like domain
MPARYRLTEHPDFTETLSREDLAVLVGRGSLGRGDICEDVDSGRSHTVGELTQGMGGGVGDGSRIARPAYMEIRADGARFDESEEGDLEDDEEVEEDNYLYTSSGERVLYHGNPSWLSYSKALFLSVLLAVSGALAVPFGLRYAALGFLCSSSVVLCVGIARFSRDYFVTEDRVEVLWGLIGRSSKEVRIRDIRSIDVREGWITGLLGLGSVDFSSSANAGIEVAFDHVRKAHRIKELVRRLQRLNDGDDD